MHLKQALLKKMANGPGFYGSKVGGGGGVSTTLRNASQPKSPKQKGGPANPARGFKNHLSHFAPGYTSRAAGVTKEMANDPQAMEMERKRRVAVNKARRASEKRNSPEAEAARYQAFIEKQKAVNAKLKAQADAKQTSQ